VTIDGDATTLLLRTEPRYIPTWTYHDDANFRATVTVIRPLPHPHPCET
jgi:hypothetical protein